MENHNFSLDNSLFNSYVVYQRVLRQYFSTIVGPSDDHLRRISAMDWMTTLWCQSHHSWATWISPWIFSAFLVFIKNRWRWNLSRGATPVLIHFKMDFPIVFPSSFHWAHHSKGHLLAGGFLGISQPSSTGKPRVKQMTTSFGVAG